MWLCRIDADQWFAFIGTKSIPSCHYRHTQQKPKRLWHHVNKWKQFIYLVCSVYRLSWLFLSFIFSSSRWLMCVQQSYDILLLILMVLLLAQAGLTLATVVHCVSYKGQLRNGAPEREDNSSTHPHNYEVVDSQYMQINVIILFNQILTWYILLIHIILLN